MFLKLFSQWKKRRYQGPSKGAFRISSHQGRMGLSSLGEMSQLLAFRSKGRTLALENHLGVNFLRLLVQKVLGHQGLILQIKLKDKKGEFDLALNNLIESLWGDWCEKQTVEVTGRFSWKVVQNLVLKSVARDGEVLVRLVRGYNNPFNFSLQLLEADHLNERLSMVLKNGHTIRLGVEFDPFGRPVAYWLRKNHPRDGYPAQALEENERVEAKDLIHLFLPERISQVRGKSWFSSVIERMKVLREYEDAELVSSRVSAAKVGFLVNHGGLQDQYQFQFDAVDAQGNPIMDVEPGSYRALPKGWDVKSYDPQHPAKAFDHFVATIIRGISCGLGVSYNNLASDLERVNYSSLRSGSLEERDHWREIQSWLMDNFYQEVFSAWLEMVQLSGKLKVSWDRLEDIQKAVLWQCRGYPTVDPLKEGKANIELVKFGLKTRSEILAESGKDFHETVDQLKYEQEILRQNHLEFEGFPLVSEDARLEDEEVYQ